MNKSKILKVMLDLETLSTEPNARIISIGACTFDNLSDDTQDVFYERIEVTDNTELSSLFHVSASTLDWWSKQDANIRAETFGGTEPMDAVLLSFHSWLVAIKQAHNASAIAIYSNGALFDIPIIKHAFSIYGLSIPWTYKHEFCYRTILAMHSAQLPTNIKPNLAKHNALEDAKYQARVLEGIFSNLRLANGAVLWL